MQQEEPMGQVNAYIKGRFQYNEFRRMHLDANLEFARELEVQVFEPEYYHIVICGRSVHTVYTNAPHIVNWWISEMEQTYDGPGERTIGLDIQVLEDSVDHEYEVLSTIQLCINNQCLVYHMYLSDVLPTELQRFLTDPKNNFLGINLKYELECFKYWTNYPGRIRYRDLTVLAFPDGVVPNGTSVVDVTKLLLRQYLVLPDMYTDWDFHTLMDSQIIFACAYAHLAYRCGVEPFPVA